MPNENIENNMLLKQKAIMEVMAKKQQAQTGGNVDNENDIFDEIITRIREGSITAEDGIRQAENIENRRNER